MFDMFKPSFLNKSEWAVFCKTRPQKCAYCNVTTGLTVDHIIPRARGGTNDLSNLQWLCMPCNLKKNIGEDEQWSRQFYYDQPINLHAARSLQRKIHDGLMTEDAFFGRPISQYAGVLFLNAAVVGSGKTLATHVFNWSLNHLIRTRVREFGPRVRRVLYLTKERAIRDQLYKELRDEVVQFGFFPNPPRVICGLDEGTLNQHDLFVACVQEVWNADRRDAGGRTVEQVAALLANFQIIHCDELHWAEEQFRWLANQAVLSVLAGWTSSPIDREGQVLPHLVLLTSHTYQNAVEEDQSLKLLTADPQHIVEIPVDQFSMMEGGTERRGTDVDKEPDYSIQLEAAKTVCEHVLARLHDLDRRMMELDPRLAQRATHRPADAEPLLSYPPHGLIVTDSIETAETLETHINDQIAQRPDLYPRGQGWQALVVHSGEADSDKAPRKRKKEDTKRKPLDQNHPWFAAKCNGGQLTHEAARILIAVNMGREGINNPYCVVTGAACRIRSQIEAVQRLFGRPIRSVDKRDEGRLLVPPDFADAVYVVTHAAYKNGPTLQKALDFLLHMDEHFSELPTLEDLKEGLESAPKAETTHEGLPRRERMQIACRVSQQKQEGQELDREKIIEDFGGQNEVRRDKVAAWIKELDTNLIQAIEDLAPSRKPRSRPVLLVEAVDRTQTPEQLLEFLRFHRPNLGELYRDRITDPVVTAFAQGAYDEHAKQFRLSVSPSRTNVEDIRRQYAWRITEEFGTFLSRAGREATHAAVGTAVQMVLGIRESVEKSSKYDIPQVHVVLTRPEVAKEIHGYVCRWLIRKGFIAALSQFSNGVEDETEG